MNRLKTYGLSAEIATNNSGSGSGLLVQGQIVSIDRGKTTKRALIGLGTVGGIEADTQLYDLAETGPPRFLMALEGQTANGGAPDAARLADAVAKRIRGVRRRPGLDSARGRETRYRCHGRRSLTSGRRRT